MIRHDVLLLRGVGGEAPLDVR